MSREDCVFPYAYFEATLLNHDEGEWSYFGLCGCPSYLVEIVMQLARLSAEKRKSSSMKYVTFDNTFVWNLKQSLESWHYTSPPTAFSNEECLHQDQDSMHCSEAWRDGLLLYLYRVFEWEPETRVPMCIVARARAVVDHIFACRDDSMISRQALLPLIFAACELSDKVIRGKILDYCSFWNAKTRYHMFNSAPELLQQVWAEQEKRGSKNTWWGQVVDRYHATGTDTPSEVRFCFG